MNSGLWLRLAEPGRFDESANRRVQGLAAWLIRERPPGVTDVVPGFAALYVEFDSRRITSAGLKRLLAQVEPGGAQGRVVEVPVRYDGQDLARAAASTGLDQKALVRLHSQGSYHVYSTSFSPGMPLAGALDERLHLPRLGSPRRSVPAGAVAVAGAQTGVYTVATPGGWNLLGSSLVNLYDPARQDPFLVAPLDTLRFRADEGPLPEPPGVLELLPAEPRRPLLEVLEPGLFDLVLDRGRSWVAASGLSRSGPLDTRAAAIANALLGNHPDAPLLEMSLLGPLLEASGTVVVAVTGDSLQPLLNDTALQGWSSFRLVRGDRLAFRPTGKGVRSYLAIAGGIESQLVLGSRSTDVKALLGRPLKPHDRLGPLHRSVAVPGRTFRGYGPVGPRVVLRVHPGPQFSREAAEALLGQEFSVASADRMGVRLTGGTVPGGEVVSEPVPAGSVQVAPAGEPIILLNDRGQVGGYAKPVVLDGHSQAIAGQLAEGCKVRFLMAR